MPLQLECLVKYSVVIDGVAETVARLRKRGIKIGSTTGYTRAMLDRILQPAAEQGYAPDCAITPDDVGAGRPHPWMIYANAIRLQVEPLEAIVKIGDTPVDIEEGLRARVWTIGVARTGNMIGLSAEDFAVLAPAEQATRLEKARAALSAAGAHESMIDAVAACASCLRSDRSAHPRKRELYRDPHSSSLTGRGDRTSTKSRKVSLRRGDRSSVAGCSARDWAVVA